ncbi:MAG: IS110 family transposase [Rhodospirillales bacterium]|nr:IS110 family transposase [Rhodospirillales bacterium]
MTSSCSPSPRRRHRQFPHHPRRDHRDAEAIAEAASRPTMRFVPLKSEAQLDVQALHRARERLVAERTALINQLRALLLERGIVLAQRWRSVAAWTDAVIADDGSSAPLSPRLRLLIADMRAEWTELDRRIAVFDDEFAASARADEAARRLATVPGIGPINATALVAAIGDASAFRRARDLAAWLGLVPKQSTTGGKPKLLGITKRGSRYLRKNLIHGARAVLPRLMVTQTRLGQWLRDLLARAHKNTVVVALAAKLARIVWAVLTHGRNYEAAVTAS